MKGFQKYIASLLIALLCFSGCTKIDAAPIMEETTGSLRSLSVDPTKQDVDVSWSVSDTQITLHQNSASIVGTGASAAGSNITIAAEGTYVLTGTLSDGQIVIAAANTDDVHLVLNGVSITNQSGAPIYASQCDKLVVTLVEGTQNILTDGGSNFQYANADEEPNAALFSKDDLTINGTGTLVVNAGFRNGIGSKDDLLIVNGTIQINAVNHGLRGNDSVAILDGNLTINAGNDGIQTNNTNDAALGWVLIEDGVIAIAAGHDGIQADTMIGMHGGEITITTGVTAAADATSDSYKGIKASADIKITAGYITVDSQDDSIHANGSIVIDGGTLVLSSEDDGIHADQALTVNAGAIKIQKAYEGLEAANIVVNGGVMDLVTADDAINAAGGADGSGAGGKFAKDQFASKSAYEIQINGGTISFFAGGDGIDSNGALTIRGGNIIAIINSTPDNGALDADGITTVTGGTIIYGGTGTGVVPDGNSTQSYVFLKSNLTAGSKIEIQKDDKTILAYTLSSNIQYLAFSSADIQNGTSYQVLVDGKWTETVTAGTGSTGMGGPGMGQPAGGMNGGAERPNGSGGFGGPGGRK